MILYICKIYLNSRPAAPRSCPQGSYLEQASQWRFRCCCSPLLWLPGKGLTLRQTGRGGPGSRWQVAPPPLAEDCAESQAGTSPPSPQPWTSENTQIKTCFESNSRLKIEITKFLGCPTVKSLKVYTFLAMSVDAVLGAVSCCSLSTPLSHVRSSLTLSDPRSGH